MSLYIFPPTELCVSEYKYEIYMHTHLQDVNNTQRNTQAILSSLFEIGLQLSLCSPCRLTVKAAWSELSMLELMILNAVSWLDISFSALS